MLYETKPAVDVKQDSGKKGFRLLKNELPFFVDSEWPLDSGRTVVAKSSHKKASEGTMLGGNYNIKE